MLEESLWDSVPHLTRDPVTDLDKQFSLCVQMKIYTQRDTFKQTSSRSTKGVGFAGKGTCCRDWQLEVHAQDPHTVGENKLWEAAL